MQLNENEYSLEEISQKTNISIENLEKLEKKEWEYFKRAQANGLISIIEREFKVDLSDLKAEANIYYKEHQTKEPNRTIDLVDAATVTGGGNRLVSNIITFITLCALGYAGWYYFIEQKEKNALGNNATQSSSGMFTNTINNAKELLGSTNTKGVATEEKNSSKKFQQIKSSIKEESVKSIVIEINNSNSSSSEVAKEPQTQKLTKDGQQPKKFDITTVQEESSSSLISENNKTNVQEVVVATPKAPLDNSNNNATIKNKVDQLLKELDENSSQKEENSSENSTIAIEDSIKIDSDINQESKQLEQNTTANTISKVTFKIKSKRLWMGIYNLTTGKRVNKIVKKSYKLEIGNDKFAIITGHNAFEISTDNGVKSFPKKGKIYLAISADGVEELTRKEYKKLTKRRAW